MAIRFAKGTITRSGTCQACGKRAIRKYKSNCPNSKLKQRVSELLKTPLFHCKCEQNLIKQQLDKLKEK